MTVGKKSKYTEEDYLCMFVLLYFIDDLVMTNAREVLREIVEHENYVPSQAIPQVKELLEQLPNVIGTIIVALHEMVRFLNVK
jgi:hypothetical protein